MKNDEEEKEIRRDGIKEVLKDLRGLLEFYIDKRSDNPKDNLFVSKCRQFGIDPDEIA